MVSQPRPRVLVLTHNFPRFLNDISGIGFQPLYQSLVRRLDLHFVVPHDAGLPEYELVNGLHVHRFRYAADEKETLAYRGEMHKRVLGSPFLAQQFLKKYLDKAGSVAREIRPLTIWSHWWIPGGIVARKTSAQTGVPFVVTCHGTDIHLLQKMSFLKPMAKRVFSEAKRINVVSSFLKNNLVESIGEEFSEKIAVAPLIVDTAKIFFDPSHIRRTASIISASRYTRQKNLDILLRAIHKLKSEGVACTLDLHGNGPEESALRALASDLQLADRVQFLPPVTQAELADRYRASEIVCLVSEREGFGLMLVEAMMCGCVAVGANSGGIADIISKDGFDGMLVEPRSVDSLADALRKLLTDKSLLNSIAASGRQSVQKNFSPEFITSEFLTLLTK
ncbi:MAG: glycosyltransferase [Candidatus Zixiibacteriota bacterium]